MKHVLIIGNGFDIAHGLPTRFKDFSKYLLEKILIPDLEQYVLKAGKSDYFTEEIRKIYQNHAFPVGYNTKYSLEGVLLNLSKDQFKESLFENRLFFLDHLKNRFLSRLYWEEDRMWFDVESTYFNELNKIHKSYAEGFQKSKVQELNQNLNEIKKLLKEYLLTLDGNYESPVSDFTKKFIEVLKNSGDKSNDIYVIDFNYTQTIRNFDIVGYHYYPIHGTLETDIIFGWGNDKDEDYTTIKNLNDDSYLENFKTHHYLKENHYQSIYNRLVKDQGVFCVYVFGHSLGLTDKSLLQEIFESNNCHRIYLYLRADKYNPELTINKQIDVENEYTRLTMAISRIIDDQMARIKVSNMMASNYFPSKKP